MARGKLMQVMEARFRLGEFARFGLSSSTNSDVERRLGGRQALCRQVVLGLLILQQPLVKPGLSVVRIKLERLTDLIYGG